MTMTQPHECSDDGKMKPAAQYICELAAWGRKLEAHIAGLKAEDLKLEAVERQRDDLAALVRRLTRDIQREHPYSSHAAQAMDYLKSQNLQGSPLRGE